MRPAHGSMREKRMAEIEWQGGGTGYEGSKLMLYVPLEPGAAPGIVTFLDNADDKTTAEGVVPLATLVRNFVTFSSCDDDERAHVAAFLHRLADEVKPTDSGAGVEEGAQALSTMQPIDAGAPTNRGSNGQ